MKGLKIYIDDLDRYHNATINSAWIVSTTRVDCQILVDSSSVKYIFEKQPLEVMRRIAKASKKYSMESISWKIVAAGIQSDVSVIFENGYVTGCQIEDPAVCEPWSPNFAEKEIFDYLENPKYTYEKLRNELTSHYLIDLEPRKYVAIHTPKRGIKIYSADYESDVYKTVLLNSGKLLRRWQKQACCVSKPTRISKLKSVFIDNEKPHWRHKEDAMVFCSENEYHLSYPIPRQLAEGVCLCNGSIEITNGRHRIANSIFSGAPFIPVMTFKSSALELEENFGW